MARKHVTYGIVGTALLAGAVCLALLVGKSPSAAPADTDSAAASPASSGVAVPPVVLGAAVGGLGETPVAPPPNPVEMEAAIHEAMLQRFGDNSEQRMEYLRQELVAETERVAMLSEVVDELRRTAAEHPEAAEAVDDHLRRLEMEHRVHRVRVSIYRRLGAAEP